MDEVYLAVKTTEFNDLTGIRFQSKERIPFCFSSMTPVSGRQPAR